VRGYRFKAKVERLIAHERCPRSTTINRSPYPFNTEPREGEVIRKAPT